MAHRGKHAQCTGYAQHRADAMFTDARLCVRVVFTALKEDLAEEKRDNFLTLQAVRFLISTHPGVFNEGQGADVRCFLLVLVPALTESHLSCVRKEIVTIIDEFTVLMAHRYEVCRSCIPVLLTCTILQLMRQELMPRSFTAPFDCTVILQHRAEACSPIL